MEFTKIVRELLKERKISINKMLTDLSLGAGTFATWEKRGTIPSGEVLDKLANYFGVSVDYLLGNEKAAPVGAADEREAALIQFFRSQSEEGKDYVLKLLQTIPKGEK